MIRAYPTRAYALRAALIIATLLLSILAGTPARAESYEAGLAAFDKGDFDTAAKEWRPMAEGGDARAQHGMGLLYEIGSGVEKRDYAEAVKW
ncbi:MAG: hypothetical protein ACREFM_21775 [Hypericibacter sp.]